jgi:hypothetical protein
VEVKIEAQAAVEAEADGTAVQSGQCMCMHFCTLPSDATATAAVSGSGGGGNGCLVLLAGYEDGKVAVYTQEDSGTGGTGGRWQPAVSVKLHEEPVLSIADATVRPPPPPLSVALLV